MYYNKFAKIKRRGGELLNFVCILSYFRIRIMLRLPTAEGGGRPLGTGKMAVFPERVAGLERNIGAILFQKS